MGVMLCVMLIGKFPFEGDTVSTRTITDPMKKVFLQQTRKLWSDNELLKSQLAFLSPEV